MENLDKAAALSWFKAHKAQEVELKWRGKMVRLRGRCTGVQSLDACSAEYEESQLLGQHEAVQIGISFHDDTLGVQLSIFTQDETHPAVFVPLSIPYDQLELSTPEAKKAGGESSGADSSDADSSGKKDGEPEFSPYELLH